MKTSPTEREANIQVDRNFIVLAFVKNIINLDTYEL